MELISLLLSCPVGSLPSLLATPAISSTLLHLIHSSTPSSPHRVQLQQLVSYLATLKGGLSLPLLAVYCQSYGSTNRELVKQTVDQGLKHDAQLSHQLMEVAPQLMDQALKDTLEAGHTDAVQLHLTLAPHLALAVSHPLLSSSYGQSQTLLRSIHKLYTSLSSSQSSSLAPSLELKLSLLETIHTLLSAAFLDPLLNPRGAGEGPLTREERNAFIDELEAALLPLLPPPMVSSHSVQSLVSASLLQDLQQYYQLSAQVDKASQGLMGEREGRAKELLRRVRESVGRVEGEDGLEVLRRLRLSGGSAAASVQSSQASTGKGKAKAASQDAPPPSAADEPSPLAISQISDLFPDLSPSFVRSCLLHPAFSGGDSSAERVISALLEDSLPDELKRERDGAVVPEVEEKEQPRPPRVATPPPVVAPTSRRNVFDDQLVAGKMRRGKERSTADSLLADRTFMDSTYKASIIAAAERESSDEEGEEGEAFVEDFDAGGRSFGVRDAGEDEHEESREKESRDVTPAGSGRNTPVPTSSAPHRDPLSNPFGPAVSHYLEETYIRDPSLFDRKGEVRRSKERKLLRERTGLSDEQVEGWRVMLERDPKKDKILARHGQVSSTSTGSSVVVTTTAIPQANTNHLHDAPSSTRRQGGPPRGGGGGGGRGGGSSGRGGGDAGRGGARGGGAARGKSDGGRAASDRRTRGADRKASKVV